jgi:choline kinase
MKAIIVAAGPGSRLAPFTNDRPKCLLDIGGKTILQEALEALRDNGIERIAVVRGYRGDRINYPDIKYYENPDYDKTNLLKSLFCAEAEMDDDILVSYSDIIYSSDTVKKLIASREDISLTVDVGWAQTYDGRNQHPTSEAELVKVEDGNVVKIGKGIIDPEEAHGEFIGLAKFTKSAAEDLKATYHRVLKTSPDMPFQRAASLEQAYIADILQELVDTGSVVKTVDINGGWIEIDTPQDLARARGKFSSNS